MLSHQPSNATRQQQQPRHRRQQSTPTALEASSIALSPANPSHNQFHRRGMSLIYPSSQDERQVGITNPGHTPQHNLQEAQLHSQAPPGLSSIPMTSATSTTSNLLQEVKLSEEEFRTLQHRQLDAHLDYLMRNAPIYNNNSQHYISLERSRSSPEHPMGNPIAYLSQQGNIPMDDASLLAMSGRSASSHGSTNKQQHQHSPQANGQAAPRRPFTPPNRGSVDYAPMSPSQSPYTVAQATSLAQVNRENSPERVDMNSTIRASPRPISSNIRSISQIFGKDNMADAGPDPNATIKPVSSGYVKQKVASLEVFAQSPFESTVSGLPSPPPTISAKFRKFDVAAMPSQGDLDEMPALNLTTVKNSYGTEHRQQQPNSNQTSPAISTLPSSPEFGHVRRSTANFADMRMYGHLGGHSSDDMDFELYDSEGTSPNAMSIEELTLDGTIEDTGITAEEVQAYVSEQDPVDQKWTCMYPECGKRFGRRENIRSHIQTHLGDRQFKCAHCSKRFVRQHDLKRHSKIHSGVKPYPCQCGQSFARHDALTRHRQRNMCVGAFEGIVKKTVKRGRPRKNREGEENRLEKSRETRKRAAAKSYASSVSYTSDSSRGVSPTEFTSDGFGVAQGQAGYVPAVNSTGLNFFPPDFFSCTPPQSPYSTGDVESPRKSQATHLTGNMPPSPAVEAESDKADAEDIFVLACVATSNHSPNTSQADSPPELDHSSPPPSVDLPVLDFGSLLQEHGADDAEFRNDFDMYKHTEMFDSSWDDSHLLSLAKESQAYRMEDFSSRFDDDVLFSEDCQGPNMYI